MKIGEGARGCSGEERGVWRFKKKRFLVRFAAHDESADAEEGDDVGGGRRRAHEYTCRDVTCAMRMS